MRIYSGCIEAAKEIERDLVEMGQQVQPQTMQDIEVANNPDYMTKELLGYNYMITDAEKTLQDWVRYFQLDPEWLHAELEERTGMQEKNPGDAWRLRRKVWEPFIHEGKFSYTYSERITHQLAKTLVELAMRPGTRQGVISIYEGKLDQHNRGGQARVPCSMYYQFIRRVQNDKDKLNLLYTMRSCDFYTHFPYDVALAIGLQSFIAEKLGIEVGFFQHCIGSLHAYAKDYLKKGVF